MGSKRTKEEALERIDDLPSIDLPYHKNVPALAHVANKAYEWSKPLARGLIMLDPFNRLADDVIVLPVDMVAIPAYQAFMIQGNPSMQIYIRAGETIVPTGGNVQDFNQGVEEAATLESSIDPPRRPRTKSAYTKRYEKAFKALKPKHTLKNGKWKKDGFKRCVKAAHATARKK